ncbi:hypothetical protein C8R46DRAFT_1342344 [Mycena filopes]|nr:hypothetical protein C8R46DRAFT_1342344 [Mycena filopes]
MSLVQCRARPAFPTTYGMCCAAATLAVVSVGLNRILTTSLYWDVASAIARSWPSDLWRLAEYATTNRLTELTIVLNLRHNRAAQWRTFTVNRHDRKPLLVGDVLNAIHQHLALPLTCEETYALGWPHGPWRRVNLVKGQYFSGLTYLGGKDVLYMFLKST